MTVSTFFWPFKPNWKTPVVESFQWHTTITRVRAGIEQRRGLRDGNRRGLEYDFLLKKEDAQYLDNLLFRAQAQAFYVPDWQYRCKTTADVAIGASIIPGDVTSCPFKAIGTLDGHDAMGVVLYRDRDTYELATLSAVADNQLTLTTPTTKAWPAGTTFFPYGKCKIEGNVATKRLSDQVTQGRVSFRNYPGKWGSYIPWGTYAEGDYTPGYESLRPTQFVESEEVFLARPDWNGGIDFTYELNGETEDSQIGTFESFLTEEFGAATRPMRFLFKTRKQALIFKEFLGRRWGRRKAVLMPTWTDDAVVVSDIASGDTSVLCKNTGFGELLFNPSLPDTTLDVSRVFIMIRTFAHGDFIRSVTQGTITPTTIQVVLSSALGAAVPMSDIKTVHFMNKCRLVSDEVSLVWHTDQVATADISVVTVLQ